MKKELLKIAVVLPLLAILLVAFNYVHAASSQNPFGGVIINTKATEIQQKEAQNFKCIVPGQTITIRPKGRNSRTTFFIPAAVKQRGGSSLRANQNILGYFSQSMTTISCIYQGYPTRTETVTLPSITLFGTNK